MARRTHSRSLNVWMNGNLVGRWTIPASGAMAFTYEKEWASSDDARPISMSLPLSGIPLNGPLVNSFFDNLLPDSNDIRARLQSRFRTASQEAFDLLEAIGRDCVGAVQLLPVGKEPEDIFRINAQPLTDEEVEKRIELAITPDSRMRLNRQIEDDGEFRISIAGAQEKTAFLWHEGQWCAPHGSTPTTHIFKLPIGLVGHMKADMRTSVENEWLCSEIVHEFGLPVARCQIANFGLQKVLIVERFDRKLSMSGTHWLRLPQEDFCQAMGYPSALKYESDGGPGLDGISKVLSSSENPYIDKWTLLRSQIIYWLLAATDGHAKNFSLFIHFAGKYHLTPLYDVLSAWPVIGQGTNNLDYRKTSMAMSLHGKNRHRFLAEIQRRHFVDTGKAIFGFPEILVQDAIDSIVERVPTVIEAVGKRLPEGFPMDVFESVATGMKKHANKLEIAAKVLDATTPTL